MTDADGRDREALVQPNGPRVLHVVSYRFGRRHHPATWRVITGLARHFPTVVLSGDHTGYFPESHSDDFTDAVSAGIQIYSYTDRMATLREPVAGRLAQDLAARYGQIDVIIGHLLCGALGVDLARRLTVPIIATFHGDDANFELNGERYGDDYARLRVAPAGRFLAVSGNLAQRLISFGMPPNRTFVHHLGLDLRGFVPPIRRENGTAMRVSMVGSFRRSKGHHIAIRAFAIFLARFPGASLHFYGSSDVPEQLQHRNAMIALTRQLHLQHAIHFHGPVPIDALAGRLADTDIAIQPSVFLADARQTEGIPNAVLEAMAMQLPVIATRHGGIPEVVEHERTGLLIEEHDPEALASALVRLAADSRLRESYGREGRRRVESGFDWIRQSDLLAGHVRQTIADYRALNPALARKDTGVRGEKINVGRPHDGPP